MTHRLRSSLSILLFVLVTAADAQLLVRGTLNGTTAGTMSAGSGTMFGSFSADYKTLTYQITVAKLSGPITAAHFHLTATGSVITSITFAGNTVTGSWTNFPDTLLKYIFHNGIYINVHTSLNPGGEIRGYLGPAQFMLKADITGGQAGTTSTGEGTGFFRFKDTTGGGSLNTLQYSITFAGLTGTYTQAHFHASPSGAVLQAITFSDSATASGSWSGYADSVLTLLLHGKIYVNIHSSTSPAGEIRGIVMPAGELPLVASLDGSQAGTTSLGKGTAYAVLSTDQKTIRYGATYARLSAALTAAHFHSAPSGSVIQGVTFTGNSTSGSWTGFSDANLQDLLRGRIYLNLHTSTNPGGEIRGTLYFFDGTFTTMLNGSQAGTTSTGTGTAWLHFGGQADSAAYQVTFAGLGGTYTASHFHLAPSGTVVKGVTVPDSATGSGTWFVPDSLTAAMVKGQLYLNIHSTVNPGGEIRGSLVAGSGVVTAVEQMSDAIPSSFQLEQNYPNPFNPSTNIRFTLQRSGMVRLNVYNMVGQPVATLIDGPKSAGTYSVSFDASRLPSGVYFYRLSASPGSVETRKMVLLK